MTKGTIIVTLLLTHPMQIPNSIANANGDNDKRILYTEKPSLDIFIGICKCLNVTPEYLLPGAMHTYNIPQDILDKLRLCNQSDIELARDFIELLIKRNIAGNTQNGYMFP